MKNIFSAFFLLILLTQNIYSQDSSELIDPEIFDDTSIELDSKFITKSLEAKNNGKPVIGKEWMIVTANAYASKAGA